MGVVIDTNFDKLFIKVALHDDEQAFSVLFNEFYPALCIFANRIINDLESSEDIVQDSFYKIWKNRKSIDIDSSFRNFLITTVRNNSLDFIRRKDLSNAFLEKNKLKFNEDSFSTPEVVYTLNELEKKISDALSKLPDNIRQAFEMSRFRGMTYNEIAGSLSLSPKTIESYISKALVILRENLKDYLGIFFFL